MIDRLFRLALRYKGRYVTPIIRMAKLTQSKNGDFVSRKGIPADVRDAYTRLYRGKSKAALRVTKAGGKLTAPSLGGAVLAPRLDLPERRESRMGGMVR